MGSPASVVERRRERRPDLAAEEARRESGGLVRLEGRDDQLLQPTRAAEIGSQTADQVVSRQLVAAVSADHEDRLLLERERKRRHERERRLVGPLEVVQEDDGGTTAADRLEGAADRLEQRRAIRARRRASELGENERQVRR
jgi:hypothetical protein